MSSIMQELIDEAVDETLIRIAAALLKRGFPPEDVAEGTGLSLEKVKALAEEETGALS